MLTQSPPTSQKDRPISFVLDDRAMNTPVQWIPLVIRPEDLTRTLQSRLSVHQTLGNDTPSWVDNFGPGLPTISIAGHTGWRTASGQDMDGAQQFMKLQTFVFDLFHLLKQTAVDEGLDPALVKLLFVDELDNFAYEVAPTSFVLRRSKSRPLLMQYNIQLQAVSTTPEVPSKPSGDGTDIFSGLGAFGRALRTINGLVKSVMSGIKNFIGGIASAVNKFLGVVNGVFNAVRAVVGTVVNGVRGIANGIIGIAKSFANAGRNIFNTIAAIKSIPGEVKHAFQRMGAAFNEAGCVLSNSLKAKGKRYPDYSSVYGASNCSSTTGGRPASQLGNMNVFSEMRPISAPVVMSSSATSSLSALDRSDPVLSPMSTSEIGRHAGNVADGYGGVSPSYAASVNSVSPGTLA